MHELKEIMHSGKVPSGMHVRIDASGQGCAGNSYRIGFDTKTEQDKEIKHEGVIFLISPASFMFLMGKKIDFVEEENQQGFVFE